LISRAGFHVEREALLSRAKAQLLVRPSLTLNGNPMTFAVLEEPVLEIRVNGSPVATSQTRTVPNTPPEASRRENWWYYSQSGPGVYQGDVYFYSNDWDGREEIKRIDTNRCKVALLTGEYDYSCTPAMSEAVAAAIPGARLTIMKGMGHFPMIENYAAFQPYLLSALQHVAG
jgi:pimeloyl-ACP methyl ester carboxylesterase